MTQEHAVRVVAWRGARKKGAVSTEARCGRVSARWRRAHRGSFARFSPRHSAFQMAVSQKHALMVVAGRGEWKKGALSSGDCGGRRGPGLYRASALLNAGLKRDKLAFTLLAGRA